MCSHSATSRLATAARRGRGGERATSSKVIRIGAPEAPVHTPRALRGLDVGKVEHMGISKAGKVSEGMDRNREYESEPGVRGEEADEAHDQVDDKEGMRDAPKHGRPRQPEEHGVHVVRDRRLLRVAAHFAKRSTISAAPKTMAM